VRVRTASCLPVAFRAIDVMISAPLSRNYTEAGSQPAGYGCRVHFLARVVHRCMVSGRDFVGDPCGDLARRADKEAIRSDASPSQTDSDTTAVQTALSGKNFARLPTSPPANAPPVSTRRQRVSRE